MILKGCHSMLQKTTRFKWDYQYDGLVVITGSHTQWSWADTCSWATMRLSCCKRQCLLVRPTWWNAECLLVSNIKPISISNRLYIDVSEGMAKSATSAKSGLNAWTRCQKWSLHQSLISPLTEWSRVSFDGSTNDFCSNKLNAVRTVCGKF